MTSPCLCGPHALTPHLSMTRVVSTSGCGDAAVDAGRQGPLEPVLPTLLGKHAEADLLGHRVASVFFSRGTSTLSAAAAPFCRCDPGRGSCPVGAERTTPTEPTAGGPAGSVPDPPQPVRWPGPGPAALARSPCSEAGAEGQVWGRSCAQDPTWGGQRGQLVRLSFPG